MNSITLRQAANTLAVIATIVMNFLASALPLNGQTTGAISDRFQVFFVPAGYVFSIWGVIYLGLIAYSVYQSRPAQRENARLRAIDGAFVLSCVANVAWLFFWHYEQFVLTVPVMLALLGCLIYIYLQLGIGRAAVSAGERWFVHLPFSIYLGWITVATIANITSTLDSVRWDGWGVTPELWTVIMLAAGVIIAALMAATRRDVAYLLVLVWAYVGIAVKQAGAPLVANAALVAAGLIALAVAAAFVLARRVPATAAGR
jgi:hypothetical protein